jgi:hypothetical protein
MSTEKQPDEQEEEQTAYEEKTEVIEVWKPDPHEQEAQTQKAEALMKGYADFG